MGISPPPIFPPSSNCSIALSGGGAGVGPVLSGGIGRGGGCCCNEGGCLGDSREPTPESGGSGGGCDGDGGASSSWT